MMHVPHSARAVPRCPKRRSRAAGRRVASYAAPAENFATASPAYGALISRAGILPVVLFAEGTQPPTTSIRLIWLHLLSEPLNEQCDQFSKEHTPCLS